MKSSTRVAAAPISQAPETPPLALALGSRRQLRFLYGVAIFLSLISFAGQFLQHGLGFSGRGLDIYVKLTDVDAEENLPTWFQSMLLLVDAVALWLTARRSRAGDDRWPGHWTLLAVAFTFLSLDEFAMLHEKTVPIVHSALNYSWVPDYAWVVLAVPCVLIFAAFYIRFLIAMPAPTRWGLLVAGAIYVGGAVGMELVGSHISDVMGEDNIPYSLEAGLEELMEMIGSITMLGVVGRYALRSRAS